MNDFLSLYVREFWFSYVKERKLFEGVGQMNVEENLSQ